MGAVAGPAAGLSAGLGLVSSVMSGEGTKAADDFQAAELSQKAQIGQIAATETNSDMVARLNQSLGNIDAVRAAGGDNPASPTAEALRSVTADRGNQAKAITVGNILQQSATDAAGAAYQTAAGSFALQQGWLSGLAGAAGTIAKTNFGSFGLPGSTNGKSVSDQAIY